VVEKKIYLGDQGPFLFDDADLIADPDGDFSGESQIALRSDQNVQAPEFIGVLISSVQVTSIDDPSTEFSGLSSSTIGGLVSAYQVIAGSADLFTLYMWDTNIGAANPPYILSGDGGYWVAVAGRYMEGSLSIGGGFVSELDEIICHDDQVVCHEDEVVYI
jgi:hypothetical protein